MRRREASATGVTWLVATVVLSLVLALVLSANPESLGGPQSPGPDSYSRSLVGYRALATYLERSGFEVARRRINAHSHLDLGTTVFITEPPAPRTAAGPDSATLDELVMMSARGASLVVVLPKWKGTPDLRRREWLHEMSLRPPLDAVRVATRHGLDSLTVARRDLGPVTCATAWGESVTVDVARGQWLRLHGDARPIVWRDSLVLLAKAEVALPESLDLAPAHVYVISDPDLLNNQGLARGEHARLQRRFLRELAGAERVVFDETVHHGALAGSLAAELLRFPLVLAVVQAVLLFGFLAWGFAARFGSARAIPPRAANRGALVHATSELLAAAGHPALTLQLYWDEVLRDVSARLGTAAKGLRRGRLDALVEVGRARGARLDARSLAEQVELQQRSSAGSVRSVVQVARRVHEWSREMIHDR